MPEVWGVVWRSGFAQNIVGKWHAKGWGVPLENSLGDRLTNLCFADDVLLVASSKHQLKQMVADLIRSSDEGGLKIHGGKTKILTNDTTCRGGSVTIEGASIEVLPVSGSTVYLGKTLCLERAHDAEIEARVDKAWKRFFGQKSDLCGKHVSLKTRLRLFNSTVTSTMLYGSGTWTMTATRERKLRTAQRRMLRWMLGSFWQRPRSSNASSDSSVSEPDWENQKADEATQKPDEETWVDWIRRCTHNVETHMESLRIDDWVSGQRRRKWRLAGHTARRDDGRWSTAVLGLKPEMGSRSRGHPTKRWADDLDCFFGERFGLLRGLWRDAAQDREHWASLEDEFVSQSWFR